MGELGKVYALGSFSFVGGSLVNIGGHNPLEPAAYHQPVIVGPYTSTVREAIQSLRQAQGILEVSGVEDLAAVLVQLSRDSAVRLRAGEAAFQVWKANIGATERVMQYLMPYVGG
jgi:3-deoxy-D-manno-octulosonic-acid transferase